MIVLPGERELGEMSPRATVAGAAPVGPSVWSGRCRGCVGLRILMTWRSMVATLANQDALMPDACMEV